MNQKPARLTETSTFRQEKLSFEKIPKQSKLFNDFQANAETATRFYPEKNTPLEKFSEKVLSNYKVDRAALCEILKETNESFGVKNKTLENIELLRDADCVTIVTGQQAGLFSGALYTIYKAFSAVKLAEELQNKGIKAVPVFWIAEEDHDFDEVNKTFNLSKEVKLVKSANVPQNYVENIPVGRVKLDETINDTINSLFENLPKTEFTDEAKRLLIKTYQSGETYSTAFAKFIAELFSDYGLIIISPLDKRLKQLCIPIFAQAVEKFREISSGLMSRNQELSEANYQPQVLVEQDFFSFFFQNESGERQPLRQNTENGSIKNQKSKTEFSLAELLEIANNEPEKLSPNALMRPVVQDFLLPTACYIGGAAEIAYFAQNSVVYDILSRPNTPIRHRASFTIIEPKFKRTLEKYDSKFSDLFDGKDKFATRVVETFLNQNTAQIFDQIEKNIADELDNLERELLKNEPTLAANLTTRRKKIRWHISALRKKYHRAELIKNETANRRLENLFDALLPQNALQERSLNAITFLNSYGENFIGWIYEAVEPEEINHQILFL